MHAFLEAEMDEKPALRPKAAIGPTMRAIAARIIADARTTISDPERSSADAVHKFRRSMKQWRALMRLLEPFVPDAVQLRQQARDHARSLARARDGQSALNAFDDLVKKGLVLSERTTNTIRSRIEAIRANEEHSVLTPELRDAIIAWLDSVTAAIESWPLDPFEFSKIAGRLTVGYRNARRAIPEDWSQASAEELHNFRQRVVDHRYQIDLVEPLWPRHSRMWTDEAERLRDRLGRCQDLEILKRLTEPRQPLAHWRSRLTPPCNDRTTELSQRAARIAHRLFAEKPRAFRQRLETLWENGR
ncbi:MAG: CHAD domain-containing protein [Xanthobacteraceae bacterium]